MKSVVLVQYCPWPVNTGTKMEMMKHLQVLKGLGECKVVSARGKPVGFGWTRESIQTLRQMGYGLEFREETERLGAMQLVGSAYALAARILRLERAFGHSNPYHRYAFTQEWWSRVTAGADLAVMQYTHWARFRSLCPCAIVTQELLSSYHWGGSVIETRELEGANLVVTVGADEADSLKQRGLKYVMWSPPAIPQPKESLEVTAEVGLTGTVAPQNLEGLRWLESVLTAGSPRIRVYGNMASEVKSQFMAKVGRYGDNDQPYRECGIQLMTRARRPGLQIKAVEALACGRAIVARRGSMSGLPPTGDAWIEVDTPQQMIAEVQRLQSDAVARQQLASAATLFYTKHLESGKVLADLTDAYRRLACSKD
ncbi:MAG: hypothetical protein C0404_09075 [Verrucomicrobia bacterium]|nr:hypothetical protein [Verrucomicrobiota bacterium]